MSFENPIRLPHTDLMVGRIGLGSSFGASPEDLEIAFDHGINTFYWGTLSQRKGRQTPEMSVGRAFALREILLLDQLGDVLRNDRGRCAGEDAEPLQDGDGSANVAALHGRLDSVQRGSGGSGG